MPEVTWNHIVKENKLNCNTIYIGHKIRKVNIWGITSKSPHTLLLKEGGEDVYLKMKKIFAFIFIYVVFNAPYFYTQVHTNVL